MVLPIENWKEYRQTYQKMAQEIVDKLSLDEKIALMSGHLTKEEIRSQILNKKKTHYNEKPYWAGGLAKYNIMPVLFVDGSRGVVCEKGVYTGFPVVSLRGATFDRELEEKIGRAMATEVLCAGGNFFGGICLNLPYHPGWGRSQESYGEDTFLIGEMGACLVRGIQSLGVIACIKHFAFNSMENNRLSVNISCDKRTEQEVFLPHFKKCILAGAGAVMTAYNSYLGKMCGENDYLIQEVLRKQWGFDGFVISDFTWGIKDTVKSARAGVDIEMPHTLYYGEALKKAVNEGAVGLDDIKEAALRIVRTMLAHGDYILRVRKEKKLNKKRDFKEHIELALECAREGITLLENKNKILPLTCKGKGKTIVLLGALAEEDNLGDHGSSRTYPPYVIHSERGIWQQLSGAQLVIYSGESKAHCKRLAREADAVIIIAGNSYLDEGEHIKADDSSMAEHMHGGDRIEGISLPKKQVEMIEAVSEIRKDAILVLTGGSAIIVEDVLEKVGAILMQFYPGMEGGRALGEILFGKISPSGRLPFSIPKKEEDLVPIDWAANVQHYQRYQGYRYFDKKGIEPRYDFGHGLSYTEFSYTDILCKQTETMLKISVTVKNIGDMFSSQSALLFIYPPGNCVDREKRLLKGFCRFCLAPGEEYQIKISLSLQELMYYDEKQACMCLEKGWYGAEIGESFCRFKIK